MDNDAYVAQMNKIPAMEWLHSNKNQQPLAGNRFANSSEARTFVQNLVDSGATAVFVADPESDEDGEYSDTLIVVLPSEPAKRKTLFAIFLKEAREQGFDPAVDQTQTQELLWWD